MKRISILLITLITILTMSACSNMTEVKTGNEENQYTIETTDIISGKSESIGETEAYIHGNSLGVFPIERTTEGIVLDEEVMVEIRGGEFELDFYRNLTYEAGLEGKYTFLVINPLNNPDGEAPLWIHFHGGASGYFDENGEYQTKEPLDEWSFNKEETFEIMMNETVKPRVSNTNGPIDNTLTRRIMEGYRVVFVSYSDHDNYCGIGNNYPNNPNGGTVNGLQASMSAIDFTINKYPTTYVFAHGASAGSPGAYNVGLSYYMEGIRLTGVICDSLLPAPEVLQIYDELSGDEDYKNSEDYEVSGLIEKNGPMADSENMLFTEVMIAMGYDVPMLGLAGRKDPIFAEDLMLMPGALEDGFDSNIDWVHSGMISENQKMENSPHSIILIDDAGHVPTITGHETASNYVDDFIQSSIEYNSKYPFDRLNTNVQVGTNTSSSLALSFTNPPFDLGNIDATYAEDISYDEYDETKFDIFLPNSEEPTGLVIYIHGGGFKTGDKSKLYTSNGDQNLIKELLSENIAVASINYRLVTEEDEDGIIKCMNDSKRALQFIRYYNYDFNIRKEDVTLMGGSAGSGTALWIAVNNDMKDVNSSDPVLRESTRVKGIAVSGVQATYDFALWSSVVFAEFDMDIDDIADLNNETNDTPMYGSISYMELESPEVIEYRNKVDMLSQITADDPEIWASSTGTSNGAPQTQSDRNHHGYHVKAIKEKADEVGVDMMCEYGNPLLYQSDNFESKVDFLIRKVKE